MTFLTSDFFFSLIWVLLIIKSIGAVPITSKGSDDCHIKLPKLSLTLNSPSKSNETNFNSLTVDWTNIAYPKEGDWIGIWDADPKLKTRKPLYRMAVNSTNGHKNIDIRWGRKLFNSIPRIRIKKLPECYQYWVAYIRKEELMYHSCLKLHPNWMQEISKELYDLKLTEVLIPGVIQTYPRYLKYPKLNHSPWYELVLGSRFLNIVVFYDNKYRKFFTKQEKKKSLIKYLNEVHSFVEQSREIVVLDIIFQGPQDLKILYKLENIIMTMMHNQIAPKHLEPNPKMKTLWKLDKRLIVTCSQLSFSKFVWQNVPHIHFSSKYNQDKNSFHIYGSDTLWTLRLSNGDNSEQVKSLFFSTFNERLWKSINILAIPCLPCTNWIEKITQANQKKKNCPGHKKTLRLLNKLRWRKSRKRTDYKEECKSDSESSIRVWPTIKAKPEFIDGKYNFRQIIINWVVDELDNEDVVAVLDGDPKDLPVKIPEDILNGVSIENSSISEMTIPLPGQNFSVHFAFKPYATEGEIVTSVQYGRPTVSSLSRGGCVGPWTAYIRKGMVVASRCISANPTWIWDNRDILGEMQVRTMVIPGSHNAGAYEVKNVLDPVKAWVVCQDEDIMNQLLYGIRYFDLRVGYYPDTEQLLWINHDVVQWLPLEDVLNDIKAFSFISPDPIILDIHRTPIGFESDEAVVLLLSLVNSTLGDYLAPADLGRNVTLGDLWQKGRTIIFSYGAAWLREEVPWLWPPIFQAWANTQQLKALRNYLDGQMKVRPGQDKIWASMGHLTPSVWDMFLKAELGIRGISDQTGKHITRWLRERWANSSNIFTSDFFHTNDIIHEAIRLNTMKGTCPDLVPLNPQLVTTSSQFIFDFQKTSYVTDNSNQTKEEISSGNSTQIPVES